MRGNVTIKDDKFFMPNGDVEIKAIFEEDAPAERKIGKATCPVSAAPSERVTEPIEKKLAKMIRKEVVQSAENAAV